MPRSLPWPFLKGFVHMKRIISTAFALLAAMAMTVGLVGTASAAKPATYTSTTSSPLLSLGSSLGLFSMEGFGGTTIADNGDIVAEVIGNPDASGKVIQKGGLTLSKADGSSLTIRNIHYDIAAGEVTGVIDDERVLLYTAEQTSETSAKLFVAPEGGAIMREFVNFLGLPGDGSEFGTSTLS